ncbi:MAG: PilZ domain-containing protein [Fimbriimonadaceae bacterium]
MNNVSPEKRRYERFAVMDYAMVQTDDGSPPFRAMIVDVGIGGIQVRSREKLPVGESCRLEIGGDTGSLVLRGEVRHCRPLEGSDLFATGVRFMPTCHEERAGIATYVHRAFVEQREMLSETLVKPVT